MATNEPGNPNRPQRQAPRENRGPQQRPQPSQRKPFHQQRPQRRSLLEKWKAGIEITAIILAGCFAVYKFWWLDVYIPSTYPPYANVECRISKTGVEDDSTLYLNASVSLKNASKKRIYILFSQCTVSGHTFRGDNFSGVKFTDDTAFFYNRNIESSLYSHLESPQPFWSRKLLSESYFESEEEFKSDFVIKVPRQYDVAGISFDVILSKENLPEKISIWPFITRGSPYVFKYSLSGNDSVFEPLPEQEYQKLVKKYTILSTNSSAELLLKP